MNKQIKTIAITSAVWIVLTASIASMFYIQKTAYSKGVLDGVREAKAILQK